MEPQAWKAALRFFMKPPIFGAGIFQGLPSSGAPKWHTRFTVALHELQHVICKSIATLGDIKWHRSCHRLGIWCWISPEKESHVCCTVSPVGDTQKSIETVFDLWSVRLETGIATRHDVPFQSGLVSKKNTSSLMPLGAATHAWWSKDLKVCMSLTSPTSYVQYAFNLASVFNHVYPLLQAMLLVSLSLGTFCSKTGRSWRGVGHQMRKISQADVVTLEDHIVVWRLILGSSASLAFLSKGYPGLPLRKQILFPFYKCHVCGTYMYLPYIRPMSM